MKGEPGAMHPGGRGSPAMQLGKNDWMDRNKQAEQIGKLVNIFAMRVMEAPPEERQAYLGSQIGGFRRTFEHAYNTDEKEAGCTSAFVDKVEELTRGLVRMLERSGGMIGHA